MAKSKPTLSNSQAVNIAYQRGLLYYKLYPYQRQCYQDLWAAIQNKECLKYTLNISRRFGKSTILCIIALEYALRYPNSQIRFAAPTGKMLKKITNPLFRMLLADCPPQFKPKYHVQGEYWVFHNGSELHCSGTDAGSAENLRGQLSHLNLCDESGFMDDLNYVLNSILTPQTLTTGGTTLLASTPPLSPSHDFCEIANECKQKGYYSTYTIHDNKSLSQETINQYCLEAGGENSTAWKREYLAQFVVDESYAIIPEWKPDYIKEYIPDEYDRYFHNYTAMDLGVVDNTAVIFGTYNFKEARLYIIDELTMAGNNLTTKLINDSIVQKEKELWGSKQPYTRISDNNNLLLLQDLNYLHQLHFNATNKDSLQAMVNELRLLVGSGRVAISPTCRMTIGCLESGIWDKQHKMFARSSTYSHFDHLASLIYLCRNLDKVTNPISQLHNLDPNTHWIPNHKNYTDTETTIQNLFKKRNS